MAHIRKLQKIPKSATVCRTGTQNHQLAHPKTSGNDYHGLPINASNLPAPDNSSKLPTTPLSPRKTLTLQKSSPTQGFANSGAHPIFRQTETSLPTSLALLYFSVWSRHAEIPNPDILDQINGDCEVSNAEGSELTCVRRRVVHVCETLTTIERDTSPWHFRQSQFLRQ